MPTPSSYNYTKTINSDQLTAQIRASLIVTALDQLGTVGDAVTIWFKDPLSVGDKVILDNLIAAYVLDPTFGQNKQVINSHGVPLVDTSANTGFMGAQTLTLNTHDWADRTTWYQRSVPVVGEALVDAGIGILFNSANPWWINIDSRKITYDYGAVPERNGTFTNRALRRPVIRVNGVVMIVGTDYTINFATGAVTFTAPHVGATVSADYYHNNGINRCSEWILCPSTGVAYLISYIELQFSKNVVFTTPIHTEIWAGGIQFGPVPAVYGDFDQATYDQGFGQNKSVYRGANDFLNICTNRSSQVLPAFGGLTQDILVFPFDYLIQILVKNSQGTVITFSLENDIPYGVAEIATGTFYMQAIPETSL